MQKHPLTELSNERLLAAPSILAANFATLGSDIVRADAAGADIIHVDVMDGHFVPNLTIGPPVVSSIRKVTGRPFDVHLMLEKPRDFIKVFAEAGADNITFHIEAEGDVEQTIEDIHNAGCSAGICLRPDTGAAAVSPYLDSIDLVLVMTVEPGFGGQEFMESVLPKVSDIRGKVQKDGLATHIEVDGGIDSKTSKRAAAAGANIMVAGTSVFGNSSGIAEALEAIHDAQKDLDERIEKCKKH